MREEKKAVRLDDIKIEELKNNIRREGPLNIIYKLDSIFIEYEWREPKVADLVLMLINRGYTKRATMLMELIGKKITHYYTTDPCWGSDETYILADNVKLITLDTLYYREKKPSAYYSGYSDRKVIGLLVVDNGYYIAVYSSRFSYDFSTSSEAVELAILPISKRLSPPIKVKKVKTKVYCGPDGYTRTEERYETIDWEWDELKCPECLAIYLPPVSR